MKYFKKQPLFIIKTSALLSVLTFLCFLNQLNAQLNFREPQSETISFQRSGLDSALSEIACASGEPKLQHAVLFQYDDEKPQYIHYDDGRKQCVAGSCMQGRGETGQHRTKCALKRTNIKWFGPRDVRNDPSAFLTAEEKNWYSGVGRIECIGKKKQVNASTGEAYLAEVNFKVTAFHVGSFDTMVTNAHAFVEDSINPKTKKIEEVRISSNRCSAIFIDAAGNAERIPIAYIESRWEKPGLFGDRSQDIAIVKLTRESKVPSTALPYRTGAGETHIEALPVKVIGYHGDVVNPMIIRKTEGLVYSAPEGIYTEVEAKQKGVPFTNRRNVFVADYPSNHGSSGSPIIAVDGKVIGIHQGQTDLVNNRGETVRIFNKKNNYNLGIFFDDQFHRDLQRIKASKNI